MPRKAKDENVEKENKKVKKTTSKSTEKATTKKVTEKKSTTKKTAEKKTTTKKATTKKTTAKKTSTRKTSTRKAVDVVEYYDLPYRYNETVVKILAQTPTILFVYWDISDTDKQSYIDKYGEFFFNDTKPVLIVHNQTMNYSFEIDINDYANSWYIHVNDSNCDYSVELGRRPINEYAKIDNYLFISSSNGIDSPNDHILFDTIDKIVYFRNMKTNVVSTKDISLSFLTKVGKIYNVMDFY